MLDHVVHTKERLEDLRSSLENALRVHDTLLGQQQNDDTKKISAYAALLMVPTIVGSVYGMNFEVMPELKWEFDEDLGRYYVCFLMISSGAQLGRSGI